METPLPAAGSQSQDLQPQSAPVSLQPPSRGYIAPWWHTVLLLVFLLAFSAMGSEGHTNLTHSMRIRLYYSTIIMEWLMALYIVWGLRLRRETTVRNLIGGRWNKPEDFLMDIAYAVGFRIASAIILAIVALALGGVHFGSAKELQERLQSVYPDGLTEQLVFQLLCVTAGFCEELIYRGYFQKQFTLLL
jgi:membrane protease YdiL (CAAX protease family)